MNYFKSLETLQNECLSYEVPEKRFQELLTEHDEKTNFRTNNKCPYCDYDNPDCEYFVDPLDNSWYHEIETSEWDTYNDDFVRQKNYGVVFCEYCGRELEHEQHTS